jgi:DNA-binding transcriptional LysR family regulator
VFAAVADHGSIAAAAAALHVTSPAVSQQIKKLEREAGCALVVREGRGIRLTPAGHVAAQAARAVDRTIATAEAEVATLRGQAVGPLRIGALNSSVGPLVGPALRLLARRHPRLVPSAWTGEAVDLIPKLETRDLDVVLVESWSTMPARLPPKITVWPLVTHEVALAVRPGHHLAGTEPVPLNRIDGEVWTACRPGTDNHEAQIQTMRRHGVEPNVRYVVDDFLTQMTLVAAGLAVTLVPRDAVESFPGVELVPVAPALTRTIGVATRQGDLPPAPAAMVDALFEVVFGEDRTPRNVTSTAQDAGCRTRPAAPLDAVPRA